jgi:kynurenine formamidase
MAEEEVMEMGDVLQGLLAAVDQVEVIDLSQPLFKGMPQSMRHPGFEYALTRRHMDDGAVRSDCSSGATDMIVTGLHLATHIDALAHISQDGMLHGGVDAMKAQATGKFTSHGIETVAPFFTRGVFLDIPAALGVDCLPPAHVVTRADLEAAAEQAGVQPGPGGVILIRTGWAQKWNDRDAYMGGTAGVPGIGEEGAYWLASFAPRACGADTIAFDAVPAGGDPMHFLPSHRILLYEKGIHIIEIMNLEELSRRKIHEFLFVLSPLRIIGATASPSRPLAVINS